MNHSSKRKGLQRELERALSRASFYNNTPLSWIGRRILGGIVHVLYMALRLVFFFWYNGYFLPWRDR